MRNEKKSCETLLDVLDPARAKCDSTLGRDVAVQREREPAESRKRKQEGT